LHWIQERIAIIVRFVKEAVVEEYERAGAAAEAAAAAAAGGGRTGTGASAGAV
jgi:hypothetical protein